MREGGLPFIRIVETAGPLRLAAVVTIRLDDPDFVFLDGTAPGEASVVLLERLRGRLQIPSSLADGSLELVSQVVAHQLVVGEESRSEEHTSELQSHHDLVC